MKLNYTPDFNNVSSGMDFELIPKGEYDAIIDTAELKMSKTGNEMLSVKVQIVKGQYANRNIFDNFVFGYTVGEGRLNSILQILNIKKFDDTDLICNKPLKIKVGIKKGNEQFPDDKNTITAYKSSGSVASEESEPVSNGGNKPSFIRG